MTALDFFYNEFVAFCNKYDIVEKYNKGLALKSYYYDLSCKPFILAKLKPNIFDHTLNWSQTACSEGHSWNEIHCLWRDRWNELRIELKKLKDSLEPTVIHYYRGNSSYIENLPSIVQGLYYREQVVPIIEYPLEDVDPIRKYKYPEGANALGHFSSLLVDTILECKSPIEFKEYRVEDTVKMSHDFLSTMKEFPVGMSAILEIGTPKKVDYLDIDRMTGKVSFLPIEKTLRKDFSPLNAYNDSNRKVTTIGRLLNKFNCNGYLDKCDIERISNFLSGCGEHLKVEIWDSNRIKEAYLSDSYAKELACIKSTLHNSCMRYPKCQDFFEFYERAHTKIAVALNSEGKICARALLWEINDSLYFLDRIYSISPFYYIRFAKTVADMVPINFYKIDRTIYNINTHLEDNYPAYRLFRKELIDYKGPAPYLDTFNIFDAARGELFTEAKMYNLHDTEGNLIEI